MRQFLVVMLLSSSFFMVAQSDTCTFSVRGTILDLDTKEPIPFVSVNVKGSGRSASTNLQGEFLIDELCTDENMLIVSCFGYCDSICQHHHEHGKMPHIYLTQRVRKLETVTIRAKKEKEEGTETIAQVTLQKEDMAYGLGQSVASLISQTQGVNLIATGTNVQLPVIHGLYGNRILVLNNGLKHGFQNWGTDHAPEIDISAANEITIIKGAAGVRFGPEALAGAIVVKPNPLYLKEPFYAEIGTGFQTNGRGVQTSIQTGKGFKKWSYFINANFNKIGDRHAPDYQLTNSGKQEESFSLGTRYHLDNWDFNLYYSYINQNLALLRSSVAESGNAFVRAINSDIPSFIRPFSYEINKPNQLTQHHFGKAEVKWWHAEVGKLTFRAGKQMNRRKEFEIRRSAEKPIFDLDLLTSDYQLEWKHPDWFRADGLLGFQVFTQNNDNNPGTGTTAFIPNYNTARYSGFLIESKRFGKNSIEGGLRFDYEASNVRGRETSQDVFKDEYYFSNLTASLGYVREISQNSSFRTNLGTAWRSPNMAELYSFGQHGFKSSFGLLRYAAKEGGGITTNGVVKIKESEVESERGYKWINELQINKSKHNHTLTLYSHFIEHYIFDRPFAVIGTIRGPMPVFIFDQTDAFFVGADYTWQTTWNEHFSGTIGFSYLWSRNVTKNEQLIDQPPLSASYDFIWNHGKLWKLTSSRLLVRPSYTFTQFQSPRKVSPESLISGDELINIDSEIFDFKDAPKGYFLLDLLWRFQVKSLSGSISVNNLFNTSYRSYLNEMRYFADEPGRNIGFTLTYLFKGKNKNDHELAP